MKNGISLTLSPSFFIGILLAAGFLLPVSGQPVLSKIETKNLEYQAGSGQKIVTSSIVVESWYLSSATISISSGYEPAEDVLIYSGTRLTGSWNASTGVLTLTGFASAARYQTALRSIKYENKDAENPSTEIRTVSFMVNDGNVNSNIVSRNITLIVPDLPPVLSNIEPDPAVFCLNSGSVAITSSLTIGDPDDFNLSSASVSINTGFTVGEDRLLFTQQDGITGSWNGTSGILTLTGTASLISYQEVLRSVRYENLNSENPHAGFHEILFTVSDGIRQSNTVSRNVVHVVPTAALSGTFSICRDEEAGLTVTLTGTPPWSLSYRLNSGAPVAVQNIATSPWYIPVSNEGTYVLTEMTDKYCPGKVSGSALVEILPEPDVSISGLEPAYSKQSSEWVLLTGTPSGGEFSGPGVVPYGDIWYFFPSLPPVGVHDIVYKYRTDAGSCYGYDTASVRIVEKSAAIEIENGRTRFCSNDLPFTVTGFNLISDLPGSFSITGGTGLVDHGNNTATVYPGTLAVNQYTLTYTTSDGDPASTVFDVGGPLIADFKWSAECFNETQSVIFTDTTSSPFGFLTEDSYHWTIHDGTDSAVFNTKNVTYDFAAPGNYDIRLHIQNSNGCVNEIEKTFPLRPVFVLASENYFEDFEEEQHWQSGHNQAINMNSWMLGDPSETLNGFPGAYSETKCWFTNITMNPAPREESWITSPCFDFTGTEKPTLVARIRRSFTDTRDGAIVKYTTDNGQHWYPVGMLNDGINWFNGYFGNPGSQSQGWTSVIDNEWIETRHVLDFLNNETVVQFRIAYYASGSALGNEGIAVDDLKIVERNRTILIEHFTNTSDPSALATSLLDDIAVQAGPNLIDLQYHTYDPNEPFYYDNPVIPDARQFYYGLTDVPYSIINGGRYSSQQINYRDNSLSPNQIGIESLYDSDFELRVTTMPVGDTMYAEAVITALQDVPLSELSVRMVVIEPLIIDNSVGGDSVYRNVVRDMLPDASGNTLYRTWFKGEQARMVESWEMDHLYSPDNIRVAAFIQNEMNREIHQASLDQRGIVNDLNDPRSFGNLKFNVFPNPANGYIYLELPSSPGSHDYEVKLYNVMGELIFSKLFSNSNRDLIPVSQLPEGLYIIRVKSSGLSGQGKIVIKR